MQQLHIATHTGTILHGALFASETKADTVVIAIMGIHGNFYSNPFYYNIGETLSANSNSQRQNRRKRDDWFVQ